MATDSTLRRSPKPPPTASPETTEILGLVDYFDAIADEYPTKGERTRCRFKAAAARIMNEKGFHDLRMADICDEAGLSHGAIYEYYKNKREIAVEVCEELFFLAKRVMRAVEPTGDEFTRITQVNLVWVQVWAHNTGLMRTLRQLSDDLGEFKEQHLNFNREWYDRVANHIDRVVGSPKRGSNASKLLAWGLGSMTDELLHEVFVRRPPEVAGLAEKPEALARLVSIFWYRMAYVANPPVELKGTLGKILQIALVDTEVSA